MDNNDRDMIIYNLGFKACQQHSTPSPETLRRLKTVETILYIEVALFIIGAVVFFIVETL